MVNDLKERVITRMKQRGLHPWVIDGRIQKGEHPRTNCKMFGIEETFRQNGFHHGLDNVTLTITVYKVVRTDDDGTIRQFDYVKRVKVPKDASDKVIDRRIDQIETALNEA